MCLDLRHNEHTCMHTCTHTHTANLHWSRHSEHTHKTKMLHTYRDRRAADGVEARDEWRELLSSSRTVFNSLWRTCIKFCNSTEEACITIHNFSKVMTVQDKQDLTKALKSFLGV